jgi:hypothetical protein
MENRTLAQTLRAAGVLAAGLAWTSPVAAASVDVTNDNGTIPDQFLSSNGGLDSSGFFGSQGNGVSVYLRARNDGGDDPNLRTDGTYQIQGDDRQFKFEFQFTPRDGDTLSDNYFLSLELDNDPSDATSFLDENTFSGRIFDSDGEDELLDDKRFGSNQVAADQRSWDDGDSVVIDGQTQRGGRTVDFERSTGTGGLPGYTVSQSWIANWDFGNFSLLGDDFNGGPSDPSRALIPSVDGTYDIRLTAYESATLDDQLARVTATVEVPAPGGLGLIAVGALGVAASLAGLTRGRL